jgi:hypothetical protein
VTPRRTDGCAGVVASPCSSPRATREESDVSWILGIPFWAGFVLGVIVTLIVTGLAGA